MLFSLDITIDYIILDDTVFKIVNKNTEIGKKKMKEKKQNNFAFLYVCVSYNRNSIKTHL